MTAAGRCRTLTGLVSAFKCTMQSPARDRIVTTTPAVQSPGVQSPGMQSPRVQPPGHAASGRAPASTRESLVPAGGLVE